LRYSSWLRIRTLHLLNARMYTSTMFM